MSDKPTYDQLASTVEQMREALKDYLSRCSNCGGVGWYQVGEDSQEQCQWCDAGLIALSLPHSSRRYVPEEREHKAKLWDALMSCERIRILGHANLGSKDGQHIGLELWDKFPPDPHKEKGESLVKFVETIASQPPV